MTTEKHFQTIDQASVYKKFRRELPNKCIQKTIAFLAEKEDPKACIGVDVGCGSGQSTFPIAPYLKKIIGIDSSEAQLAEARKDSRAVNSNVEFVFGNAESLPIEDHSIHLVLAMHAAHWFDFEAFCKEADRVLVPEGVLALCTTDSTTRLVGHEDEGNQLYQELVDVTRSHWNDNVLQWYRFYETLELPYKCFIRDHSVEEEYDVSVAEQIGYWKSTSGFSKFTENNPKKGESLMNDVQEKFMKIVNSETSPEETFVTYRNRYILLLARKPDTKIL